MMKIHAWTSMSVLPIPAWGILSVTIPLVALNAYARRAL